jgi:hypothetical protein
LVWATVVVVGAVVVVVVVVMVESPMVVVVVVAAAAEGVGASSPGVVVVAATRWASTPALLLVMLVLGWLLDPHKLKRSGKSLEFFPCEVSAWTRPERSEGVIGIRKSGLDEKVSLPTLEDGCKVEADGENSLGQVLGIDFLSLLEGVKLEKSAGDGSNLGHGVKYCLDRIGSSAGFGGVDVG